MSDTGKDRRKLKTISSVWEVVEQKDATFKLFHNSQVLHNSIPDKWLVDELAKHGLCGDEYLDIRRQLRESGKAKIVL